MLHLYYSENGLRKWYIWHVQSFLIYGLFQDIADLFLSSFLFVELLSKEKAVLNM